MARTRPHHPGDDGFGSLFGNSPVDRAMERVPPAPVPSEVRALADRVPHHLRLGTSSWAYPGWRGMIFGARAAANALARDGLAAYAAWPLFGTVGLDRAFYATPSVAEYEALASLVPDGFRFTVKAEQERALATAGSGAQHFRALVVRWMLAAGTTYESASEAFEPFDRLQAPDVPVRAEIAALLSHASPARPGFVVINNKAEGSAALSVQLLAEEVAAAGPG
jgi:hypothetical protein